MKATDKQLNYIRDIEDALGYAFDFTNGTKEEASEYISKHITEYKKYMAKHYVEMCLLKQGEMMYANE